VRPDGRRDGHSHLTEQQVASAGENVQAPAIKLRIKIGRETVGSTTRCLCCV